MKIGVKLYTEVIKTFKDGCTALEATKKVFELYPELVKDKISKSKSQDQNQIRHEIGCGFISYPRDDFRVDRNEKPYKIFYIGDEEEETEYSEEDYNRDVIIEKSENNLSQHDLSRIDGFFIIFVKENHVL